MQINGMSGMGNGNVHNHSMHQVTKCSHDHSVSKKSGNMGAQSAANNTVQADMNQLKQQEGQFSLASWLKNTLSGGKKLLLKIWGDTSGAEAVTDSRGVNTPETVEQVMAQVGDPDEGQSIIGQHAGIEAQQVMAGTTLRQQTVNNNPYFSAIEDTGREKQSLWEKVRVRFQSVAGQLAGRFSNRNSFQTKQEKPKEDLRRHSRYREENLEIDCILTDDSYLLDSYDRKGEYSKLSAKK